jgi:murein DD-endopeptidase MepM/ murein hydrolase activator NlpD
MREGTPVRSPVDGVVTKIKHIIIYETYDDLQMEIMPAGHADLRVAFLHLDQLRVKEGDSVRQGKTVLGVARDFRAVFHSEIEDYVKPAKPHVHVQLNKYIPEPE